MNPKFNTCGLASTDFAIKQTEIGISMEKNARTELCYCSTFEAQSIINNQPNLSPKVKIGEIKKLDVGPPKFNTIGEPWKIAILEKKVKNVLACYYSKLDEIILRTFLYLIYSIAIIVSGVLFFFAILDINFRTDTIYVEGQLELMYSHKCSLICVFTHTARKSC